MIKLLYEFDKIVNCALSGISGREFVRNLIIDDVSSIDISQVVCPECGSHRVHWDICRVRTQCFIWDNPDEPIRVELPLYSFNCSACRTKRTEMISTDITIDRTNLSYHYVFNLIRARMNSTEKTILELNNLLYGILCEESVDHWVRRFRCDSQRAAQFLKIEPDDLLNERVKPGRLFKAFFLNENRFFMASPQTEMLIYPDFQQNPCCIRKQATALKM